MVKGFYFGTAYPIAREVTLEEMGKPVLNTTSHNNLQTIYVFLRMKLQQDCIYDTITID